MITVTHINGIYPINHYANNMSMIYTECSEVQYCAKRRSEKNAAK